MDDNNPPGIPPLPPGPPGPPDPGWPGWGIPERPENRWKSIPKQGRIAVIAAGIAVVALASALASGARNNGSSTTDTTANTAPGFTQELQNCADSWNASSAKSAMGAFLIATRQATANATVGGSSQYPGKCAIMFTTSDGWAHMFTQGPTEAWSDPAAWIGSANSVGSSWLPWNATCGQDGIIVPMSK